MASASFIAGDWGTSHLRLYLCDATGRVLERRAGPGVARLAGDFPGALAAAALVSSARTDMEICITETITKSASLFMQPAS